MSCTYCIMVTWFINVHEGLCADLWRFKLCSRCFNSCHQRIQTFIVPVKPVFCFTKRYLDLVNIFVQFGFLLSPWQLTLCLLSTSTVCLLSTSSLESTNHSYSPSPYFLAPHLTQGHPIPLPLTSSRTKEYLLNSSTSNTSCHHHLPPSLNDPHALEKFT